MPDAPIPDKFRKPDLKEITENWNGVVHNLVSGPIVRLDLREMLHPWNEVSGGCRLISLEDGILTIQVAIKHRELAQRPGTAELISGAIQTTLGVWTRYEVKFGPYFG
jgi:hypothetical protein